LIINTNLEKERNISNFRGWDYYNYNNATIQSKVDASIEGILRIDKINGVNGNDKINGKDGNNKLKDGKEVVNYLDDGVMTILIDEKEKPDCKKMW
jgi:hypothetical protein